MEYYDKNILKNIPINIIYHPLFDDWLLIVEDILLNDEFQKRKLFMHHHDTSVWTHSILVSFKSFVAAKHYKANPRICAIAGLLHDFYPDAWIYTKELESIDNGKYVEDLKIHKPLFKKHGFVHGKKASINYIKYFPELENKKITDTIANHMFPLTIKPPRYKEGYIITTVDKLSSCSELPSFKRMTKIAFDKTIGALIHKNN